MLLIWYWVILSSDDVLFCCEIHCIEFDGCVPPGPAESGRHTRTVGHSPNHFYMMQSESRQCRFASAVAKFWLRHWWCCVYVSETSLAIARLSSEVLHIDRGLMPQWHIHYIVIGGRLVAFHQGRIKTKLGLMLLPGKGPIIFLAIKTDQVAVRWNRPIKV